MRARLGALGSSTSAMSRLRLAARLSMYDVTFQRDGCCPVVNATRDGEQIGEFTKNWLNRIPSAASRSRFGVFACRLPEQPSSATPRSSARTKITFVRGTAGGCAAGAGAAGAAAGTCANAETLAITSPATQAMRETFRFVMMCVDDARLLVQ